MSVSSTNSARRSPYLPTISTLVATTTAGVALGAVALRPSTATLTGAARLFRGMRTGALVGAVVGGIAVGADRLTGGEVHRQLRLITVDRRAQGWFILSHLNKPWLMSTTLGAANDARAQQHAIFGSHEPLDGAQDAFRHAYAAALLSLRMQRDHGVSSDEAARLTRDAGEAHERDGQDNSPEAHAMDSFNNAAGVDIVGTGRAADGSFISERELVDRVIAALATGRLQMVDHDGSSATPRMTTRADLPAR